MSENNKTSDRVKAVGHGVFMARMNERYTRQYLADIAGVSATTIQNIENGSGIRVETLFKLCDALDIDIKTLFENETN